MLQANTSFPCVLTDNDFHVLTDLSIKLSESFEKLKLCELCAKHHNKIEIYQIQKALKDLLQYRHRYGHLLTCYTLRRSIILLDYVASIMCNCKHDCDSALVVDLLKLSDMLDKILIANYKLYLESVK